MRVDVYTLVVEVGEAGDAAGEGVRGRAVAGVDVVVVALAEGEVLPGDGERRSICFGCGAFFVGVHGGGRHCFFKMCSSGARDCLRIFLRSMLMLILSASSIK